MGQTAWIVLAVALCMSVLAGCSDTSFVGKRVDNFTAYYNTFYNAQRSFDEGVEQVAERQQSEPVDMNRYINLFLTGDGGRSGGDGPFTTAIEKSADVLREHPTSKWVDESLMLIGKSYYFQQNYVGAEQKFQEVQELGTDLRDEARFWLVRTLVSSNRLGQAEEVSTAVLATDDANTWTARTWLARGESLVRQGRWGDAAQALSTGLSGDLPKELTARAAFLLGQVRETLDDPSGAQSAYRRAVNASKEYELTYAARLSAVRVQGLNGDPDAAIDELRDMERDDKNFERLAALQVLRGRLLDAAGRSDDAQTLLRDVLYGEPPAQSTVRGRAHYAMGELYRDAYKNFSRAAAHFDTASTSLEQAITTGEPVLLTPSAITNSASISERFAIVAERADRVSRMDSLLALGQLSPDSLRARLLEIQQTRLAAQEARQERQSQQEAARRFNTRTVTTNRNGGQTTTAASGSGSFLFYDNATRVQDGRRSFQRQWGNRPRVDNWRRSAAIEQQRLQTSDPDPTEAQEGGVPVAGAGPEDAVGTQQVTIDVSEIPRTSDEQAAMRSDRAVARYELATALFLNASRPDSAAVWYERVIEEDAAEPVAQQAIYALAEVRRSQARDEESRERYIQLIREYPNSAYAQRARQRLGRAPVEVADSNAVAEATYAAAFRAWQSNRIDSARSEMARVARVHSETNAAPRAVLALATISLNQTRQLLAETGVPSPIIRGRMEKQATESEPSTPDPSTSDSSTPEPSTPNPPAVKSPEMDSSRADAAVGAPDDAASENSTSEDAQAPRDRQTLADTRRDDRNQNDSNQEDSNQEDSNQEDLNQGDPNESGTDQDDPSGGGETTDDLSAEDSPEQDEDGSGEETASVSELDEETILRLRDTLSMRRPSDDFLKDLPASDSLVAAGRDRLRDELGQNEPAVPAESGARPGSGPPRGAQEQESRTRSMTPRRAPRRAQPDSAESDTVSSPRDAAEPQRSNEPSDAQQEAPQRSSLSGLNRTSRGPERAAQDSTQEMRQESLQETQQEPRQEILQEPGQRSLQEEAETVRNRQQSRQLPKDSTEAVRANRSTESVADESVADESDTLGEESDVPVEELASGAPGEEAIESNMQEGESQASDKPSPVADAYEPALNILAYLIARYPDAPQSERALTLALALAERHNMLPPPPADDATTPPSAAARTDSPRTDSPRTDSSRPDSSRPDSGSSNSAGKEASQDEGQASKRSDATNPGSRDPSTRPDPAEPRSTESEQGVKQSPEQGDADRDGS